MKFTAGDLRERVELLGIAETEGGWQWVPYGESWAGVELTGKTCLFSKVGIGARAVRLILRKRALTLHQAIRWRGMHLFLQEITQPQPGWLEVQAAVVEPVVCKGRPMTVGPMGKGNRPTRMEGAPIRFPGVVTEKYLGHAMEPTHATLRRLLVLVTPREVLLKEGDLVDVAGPEEGTYVVKVPHRLDRWKCEYEVERTADV